MDNAIRDSSVAIDYSPRVREYGIDIRDSEIAQQNILFCPWCGRKLPKSFRDLYFDTLEKLGYEPFDDNIPEKYKTDEWWKNDLCTE